MDKYDIDPEFCQWYSMYPLHKGKAAAFRAWKKLKDRPSTDTLLAILAEQKEHEIKWKQGYVPHPATYLNQERYDDELTTASPARSETAFDRAKTAIQQRTNNDLPMDALTGALW